MESYWNGASRAQGKCIAVALDPKRIGFRGMDFAFANTLHLPSIKEDSETNYRFAGVFHTLNQRPAQLYY